MIDSTNSIPAPVFPRAAVETIRDFLGHAHSRTLEDSLAKARRLHIWKKTQKAMVNLIFSQLQGSFFFEPKKLAEERLVGIFSDPDDSYLHFELVNALNLAHTLHDSHVNVSRQYTAKTFVRNLRLAQSWMSFEEDGTLSNRYDPWESGTPMEHPERVVKMAQTARLRQRVYNPLDTVYQFPDGSLLSLKSQRFYQNQKVWLRAGGGPLVDATPEPTPRTKKAKKAATKV